ncbi:MAG: LPS-assembly lipoprotein LptE [Methylococcaceae bacterium]
MQSKKIVVFVAVLLLSACGYHLRGALDMPQGFKNVYLDGASPQLREQFTKVLKASSSQLTDSPEGAGMVIRIAGENASQRVLSLSSRGRSNELELYYRLEYEFANSTNGLLMARQPLEIKREYFNNQQDIIAKSNEETVIRNEMYLQAVNAIVNRARAVLKANAN